MSKKFKITTMNDLMMFYDKHNSIIVNYLEYNEKHNLNIDYSVQARNKKKLTQWQFKKKLSRTILSIIKNSIKHGHVTKLHK